MTIAVEWIATGNQALCDVLREHLQLSLDTASRVRAEEPGAGEAGPDASDVLASAAEGAGRAAADASAGGVWALTRADGRPDGRYYRLAIGLSRVWGGSEPYPPFEADTHTASVTAVVSRPAARWLLGRTNWRALDRSSRRFSKAFGRKERPPAADHAAQLEEMVT